MPLQQFYLIASTVLLFVSYFVYEWSIVTGRTKPHRTTRFVLLLITTLGAASLFAAQDRVAFYLIAFSALNSTVIFLLSLKYGVGGWSKTDILCLLIALAGITAWKLTNNPAVGVYAAIIADFSGMVPALIKTYRSPKSEYWLFYAVDLAAITFNLLAIQTWELKNFSYPVYLLAINFVMLLLIARPKLASG